MMPSIGDDLDLAEEGCENAQIKLATYQQEVVKGYNRSVRFQAFKPNNLVWKKVVKKSKKKKFKLEQLNGTPIAKSWNANNLKKFYG